MVVDSSLLLAPQYLTWSFANRSLRLLPLTHEDLHVLYKAKRLPFVMARSSEVDSVEPVLDVLAALLARSLLKGQPWMDRRQVTLAIALRCDEGGSSPLRRLVEDAIALCTLSLDGLVSQHRGRLETLAERARTLLPFTDRPDE
jgi:hypothetical protein